MKQFLFCTIILLNAVKYVSAQSFKAILIQINSEQNRLQRLRNIGDIDEVNVLSKETNKVKNAMISDFTDNFKYCQVYYYVDTNLSLIRDKHFAGTLLNKDGRPAENVIITPADSAYFIVYYGYAESDAGIIQERKGLVICDYKLKQLGFYLNPAIDDSKTDHRHTYISAKYDIKYLPFAKILNLRIGQLISRKFTNENN